MNAESICKMSLITGRKKIVVYFSNAYMTQTNYFAGKSKFRGKRLTSFFTRLSKKLFSLQMYVPKYLLILSRGTVCDIFV